MFFRFTSALFAGLVLTLGTGHAAPTPAQGSPTRPNIVLIMADDFGYECVGANGGESCRTPNLDRLAAGGLRFENCHVQPLCTPTRVQLMTGKENVRNYLNFGTLPRTETTFANLLKENGYATGVCGKWQLGREVDSPRHFGFDESLLWQHTRRPPRYANAGLEKNGEELPTVPGSYGPQVVNDFALDFITRHRGHPFFLYYPMMLTHDPFQPTPDSPDWDPAVDSENKARDPKHFPEMTAYMDKLIGALDARLGELGLRENTLLIFLGDNGTGAGVVNRFQGRDFPGGKGRTNHRGTHVPLICSWPGVIQPGRVSPDLISSTDILPTLCAATGAPLPADLDGHSFLPRLRGQDHTPRPWLYSWYSPRQKADLTVREAAFDHHHKLYRTGELYDLTADPEETRPLSQNSRTPAQTAARQKLQAALDHFQNARPPALDEAFQKSMPGLKSPGAQKARKKQAKGQAKAPGPANTTPQK